MMLRCDWRRPGVVAATVERLRRALAFLQELPRRAAELQCLQGAILQAVAAWTAVQQPAEAVEAAAGAGAGAGGGERERRPLNSAEGRRDAGAPLLARLGPEATRALAEAAADLRGLIKVKVADDQDLRTAQQAVAEAAHFFVALQQEASRLGVSADAQLQQYVY